MTGFRDRTALALVALLAGGAAQAAQQADYVFTNGYVYTVDHGRPWAEAVAVKGNKIVYVGDNAGAEALRGDETQVVDLTGRMLLPGFVSGHDHLIAGQWVSYGVDLYSAKSKQEYLDQIKEYVELHPEEKVIRGIGWNSAVYGSIPTAKELDAIVSDRPAILIEFTVHDAWLNTRAMEAGGVDKDTPDPVPGVTYWARDEAGNPTGVGHEFAWMPAYIKMGAWEPRKMIPASQKFYFDHAVKVGLTTVLNPGLVTPGFSRFETMKDDFEVVMDLLAQVREKGELTLRTFVQPIYKDPNASPEAFAEFGATMSERYDSDNLRAFGVKIHPEGNWSSRTSLMLEPYLPAEDAKLIERPTLTSYGAAGVTADLMKQVVLAANAKGLDVFTHVDGNATVRAMIDAIVAARAAGYTDRRNALHHLFWTHPFDLRRILAMDIPVNVSPGMYTDGLGQALLARQLVGEAKTKEQFAVYTPIFANGNRISLSADVPGTPVSQLGPLFYMEAAVTRQDPDNPDSKVFPRENDGLTLTQAIRGATINPAWQIRMEDKIGSIEVGKYADLVVLEKNLFDVQPREISKVEVLATMMDGRFTYRAEGQRAERAQASDAAIQLAVASLMELFHDWTPDPHAHR